MNEMKYAYDKLYISDAMSARGSLFLQVVRDRSEIDFNHFYKGFMTCTTTQALDTGWPRVACLNGTELLHHLEEYEPHLFIKGEHDWWESAAEWSGWFLCVFQWYWNIPSPKIAKVYTPDVLLRIWPGAHSQGLMSFVQNNPLLDIDDSPPVYEPVYNR